MLSHSPELIDSTGKVRAPSKEDLGQLRQSFFSKDILSLEKNMRTYHH